MKQTILFCLILNVLGVSACSKPYDLDSPCPNYGKTCSQRAINVQQ